MATSKPTYDCFNDMPEVEPNGDISGPGVLAGFLGTAYLSILVLAVYYFRVFEPTKNPYQEQPQPSSSSISIQSTNTNEASQQHESQTLPSNRDDLSQQQEGSPSEDQLDPSAQTEADWAPNPIDIWFLENVPKIFELLHKLGQRLAAYLFPDILGRGFRNMQLICKLVYELVSMLVSRMISMLVSMSIYKLAQKWFPMALLRALKKALDTQLDPQQDTKEEIERAFNECMRSICDTQLVTGVGILFSAYYILNKTDSDGKGLITAYHWQIAVYLAWLSNLTHMTGLTFLRKYLAHHKTERLWRTVSMICLFLLVFIAFPPLLYFNWDADDIESEAQPSTASSNAFCYYQYHVARERMEKAGSGSSLLPYSSGSSAVVSMVLLFFSFCTRLVKLSSTSSRYIRVSIRQTWSNRTKARIKRLSPRSTNPGDEQLPVLATSQGAFKSGEQSLSQGTRLRYLFGTIEMAILLTSRLYIDLFTSMLSEVYWALVAGIWVSVRILKARSSAQVDEGMASFGQVLAVFLLISPLVTTLVALWPLRFALWELRQPRDPPVQRLRHIDTFPIPRRIAVDTYCQFSNSATSYNTLGSTPIITGACIMVLWATMLYFFDMVSYNRGGMDMIGNVIYLALGQPVCCLCAYLGTTRTAGRLAREPLWPDSVLSEATTEDSAPVPAPAPALAAEQTSTEQTPEAAKNTEGYLKEEQLLNYLIVLQFIAFLVLVTMGALLDSGRFNFISMGLQPNMSLALFIYADVVQRWLHGLRR